MACGRTEVGGRRPGQQGWLAGRVACVGPVQPRRLQHRAPRIAPGSASRGLLRPLAVGRTQGYIQPTRARLSPPRRLAHQLQLLVRVVATHMCASPPRRPRPSASRGASSGRSSSRPRGRCAPPSAPSPVGTCPAGSRRPAGCRRRRPAQHWPRRSPRRASGAACGPAAQGMGAVGRRAQWGCRATPAAGRRCAASRLAAYSSSGGLAQSPARFCPKPRMRAPGAYHGIHESREDDRLAEHVAARDATLLQPRHVLRIHIHSQVSTTK